MSSLFKYSLIAGLTVSSLLSGYHNIIEVQADESPQTTRIYSQPVQADQYLFVSGQVSINSASNKLIGNMIEEQTSQFLNNAVKPARQAIKAARLPLNALFEISSITFIPTPLN